MSQSTIPPSPAPPPYVPPKSNWMSYAPIGAGLAAGAFLIAGTIVGFKRGIQKSVKAQEAVQAAAARAAAAPVKPGRGAFIIGVKAFTYGTALCLVGSSVITFGVCTALGVSNLQEFSDKMREILPGKRLWLEGLLKPPLQSVTGLSPPAPIATEAEGSVLGDGLTPQEQKAIADLEQALFGKPTPPVKKQ